MAKVLVAAIYTAVAAADQASASALAATAAAATPAAAVLLCRRLCSRTFPEYSLSAKSNFDLGVNGLANPYP